ncbi:MAG: PIG-L family deacetylase [Candidatus Peribacteraceae bacterium]|nr:PIG-L family deacetylase [Candidatus Peribacteraceae bacterium]
MDILVVAAHPDDEVLGCGGTIAKLAKEGNSVHIIILGEGITSRYSSPAETDKKQIQELHTQAAKAGKILGAQSVKIGHLPDNRFDTVPLLEIIKMVEDHVKQIKPSMVFTQHGGDLNIDHERTFRAVLTATRPMEGGTVKQVYAYEVPSSTEWAFQSFSPRFHPTTFEDISNTLESKISAMKVYEQEMRAFPHPRSEEVLRAHAIYWGSVSGFGAAEAFELIREIR